MNHFKTPSVSSVSPTHVIATDDGVIPVVLKEDGFHDLEVIRAVDVWNDFLDAEWEKMENQFCRNIKTGDVFLFSRFDHDNDIHCEPIKMNFNAA
jgi:hypothetical protein